MAPAFRSSSRVHVFPLKSYRLAISLVAMFTALSTSWRSTPVEMSKEALAAMGVCSVLVSGTGGYQRGGREASGRWRYSRRGPMPSFRQPPGRLGSTRRRRRRASTTVPSSPAWAGRPSADTSRGTPTGSWRTVSVKGCPWSCDALFEHGTEEIALETALVDLRIRPSLVLRAGILLPPIGYLNQNHDSPPWDWVDRPLVTPQVI